MVLGLVALLVLVSVVSRLADWNAKRFPADAEVEAVPSPLSRAWTAAKARRVPQVPLLPEGHRPPAGLGPLSPSERFISTETERGFRAMQLWLLDQDGASA